MLQKTFQQKPWEREDERGWGFLFLAKHVLHTGTLLNSTTYYFGPVYTREMHHVKKMCELTCLKTRTVWNTVLPWGMNDNSCVVLKCAGSWWLILRCVPEIITSFVFHIQHASLHTDISYQSCFKWTASVQTGCKAYIYRTACRRLRSGHSFSKHTPTHPTTPSVFSLNRHSGFFFFF